MHRRARLLSLLGVLLVALLIVLALRTAREGEPADSPVGQAAALLSPTVALSPVFPMPVMPMPLETALPPTATPLVNQATLQAIRLERPTATTISAPDFRWPFVSPDDWRHWAMWTLGAAALLAYIAWRLRKK